MMPACTLIVKFKSQADEADVVMAGLVPAINVFLIASA
jgi:hypothetical protein